MIITYYKKEHLKLIEETIPILNEYVFDCWEKQPVVNVEINDMFDDDECLLTMKNVDAQHSLEAFNLCVAFINGFLIGKGQSIED